MDLTVDTREGGIAVLTLRRPEKLNALSWQLVRDLRDTLAELDAERSLRVLVLTGEGRGFCAGIDIGSDDAVGSSAGAIEAYERQELVASLGIALAELRKPVIAAVNGPAAGGGLAIALACDVRLAAPSARFNVAFVRLGLSGGDVGISHLLPRVVGLGAAAELMLTGRLIDAEEAARIGLVNRVVPAGSLLDEAVELAAEIARNSPFGVRMTKQVLRQNVDAPSLRAAIELENRTQILATRTEDMVEALAAFRERRDAVFKER